MTVRSHTASFTNRSSELCRVLRNDILSGRLEEGVRRTEAGLVKRFGVGRGVVREAVQQLAMIGLLITRPNCGAAVAPEAPREIRQLIVPIRRTIEAYALQLVFDELTIEDFNRWQGIVNQMQQASDEQDPIALAELDIAFHRTLLERAGQPDLIVIWDTLVSRIRSHFRRMQRRVTDLSGLVAEHQALVDLFQSGNMRSAVRLLKASIQ